MSDEPFAGQPGDDRDEAAAAALEVLSARDAAALEGALRAGGTVDPAELREQVAAWAALAWALPPASPAPATRERILARVAVEPAPQGAAPSAAGAAAAARPLASSRSVRPGRWPVALAACLAVALLGVGWLAAWLHQQLDLQRAALAAAERRLERLESELAGGPVETVADVRRRLDEIGRQLALVTTPGTEVCPLRPPLGRQAPAPAARGLLFVADDHQHWYLRVEGLTPLAAGQEYQLWFLAGDGRQVSAGTFRIAEGAPAEISSETMPAGTRAVTITLEPAGGAATPSGPVVLYGEEAMRLL
ncbi:MAG TPA: anti-sigma factor [Thermoanaerobaculia bacterium]|nr:anti-sigma factor [Thermoanaerobaculia bacterium]